MYKSNIDNRYIKRKIISISGKRQITIPQKFFEILGFMDEAECILSDGEIIIKPVRENMSDDFAEEILADLIYQGFSGQELLMKFKETSKKIPYAVEKLVNEADEIVKDKSESSTMEDIFGAEE